MRCAGSVRPPGDKSITQRALVLGALAVGETLVRNPLTGLDTQSMAGALRCLGVEISPLSGAGPTHITGVGLRGLRPPDGVLDCGNSGTAARLLAGVLAAHPFAAELDGDASLRRRPMRRVTEPLRRMGARFVEKNGDALPLVVQGGPLEPLEYQSPVASAQVKTALLLAGLVGGVPVTVTEPLKSRDHTERMFAALGLPVRIDLTTVAIAPVESFEAFDIDVPADPSSAAFLIAAAALANEGGLHIEHVGLNPTRTGYLDVLRRMGARIETRPTGEVMGEPVGDIVVVPAPLHGTVIEADEIPSLIDEVPVLAVVASRAAGETVFRGVGELRFKESDRLELVARNLAAVGGRAEAGRDSLVIAGNREIPGGPVETGGDHRVAMAFAVLGATTGGEVALEERESPDVTYPGFFDDLTRVVTP